MAFTPADVELWLGLESGSLDELELQRVIDAVTLHKGRLYDLADIDAESDVDRDMALIMESARQYARKHSVNGYQGADELGPVAVRAHDVDVHNLLAGRLIVSGMFGESGTTS